MIDPIDGKPVSDFAALVSLLDMHEFGHRGRLTVRRGRARIDVPITLSGSRF